MRDSAEHVCWDFNVCVYVSVQCIENRLMCCSCVVAGRGSSCRLGFGIHADTEQHGPSREPFTDEGSARWALDCHPHHFHCPPPSWSGSFSDNLQEQKNERHHGVRWRTHRGGTPTSLNYAPLCPSKTFSLNFPFQLQLCWGF